MKVMFKLFSHLYNIFFIAIAYGLKSGFLLYFVWSVSLDLFKLNSEMKLGTN